MSGVCVLTWLCIAVALNATGDVVLWWWYVRRPLGPGGALLAPFNWRVLAGSRRYTRWAKTRAARLPSPPPPGS